MMRDDMPPRVKPWARAEWWHWALVLGALTYPLYLVLFT